MGTNYYLEVETETGYHPVHLGKKSYGWKFLFDASGVITGHQSAFTLTERFQIRDEYGRYKEHEEFWEMVNASQIGAKGHEDGDIFKDKGYDFSRRPFS